MKECYKDEMNDDCVICLHHEKCYKEAIVNDKM